MDDIAQNLPGQAGDKLSHPDLSNNKGPTGDASWKDIEEAFRLRKAKKLGLPDTASWAEIRAALKTAKQYVNG